MQTFSRTPAQFKILLFCLLPITFLIHTIALGANHWIHSENTASTTIFTISVGGESGLFKTCVKVKAILSTTSCKSIEDPESWLLAVRAFMIVGLLVIIGSGVFCLVINCSDSPKHPINKNILGVLCSISALCAALGWIIYAAKIPSELRSHLHACFGLAIVSTLLSIINAVVSFTSPPLKPASTGVAVVAAPVISGYPATGGTVIVQNSTQGFVQPGYKQQMIIQPPPYQQTQPQYVMNPPLQQGVINPYPNQQYPPPQYPPTQQYQPYPGPPQ